MKHVLFASALRPYTLHVYSAPFYNTTFVLSGGIIMYGAFLLFEDEFIHVVAITFTSLILTELLMVALTIRTWHYLMIVAELFSIAVYVLSLVVLRNYFGEYYFLNLLKIKI